MNKEEIYDLLNRLDLQEWCTELYKVPLTWCELYDIRDYLINLEQQCKKQKETIDKVRNNLEKDISVIKNVKMSNKEIICRLEETNKMLKEVE